MTTKYDAVIIGTGQAGPALAVRLANTGMKVAIIERKKFGGTCVNTGCIPTKTLVASAYATHLIKNSSNYGVIIDGTIKVDMKKVKARKDAIVQESTQNVQKWLEGTKNCEIYKGHAKFEGPRSFSVNDETLEADKIFIDVGARAFIPSIPGLESIDYLDNTSMMELDELPEHLIIIGGSYIGLEFAQMMRRFGSNVTVIEKSPRLIAREDKDISDTVKAILEKEGINFRLGTECLSFEKHNDNIEVNVDCKQGDKKIVGSHVLLAIGRKPNTDDLGLEKAGVKINERSYIEVDDELKTNVPGIWALGECNGKGAFTHTSYNDYEIVADNLLNNDNRKISDRILIYGLFIDPPLARVGMSETEVRQSGKKALIGTRPMSRIGRAREKGETQGFIKILVDAETQFILGASILGMSGDEAIHCIADIMYAKKPYTVIQRAVHIHPTVAELIPTILGELKPLD